MPSLSIIIPTHRRASILADCLSCLENQTVAEKLEVIVVSDGHDRPTAELFSRQQWKMPVRFFEIEKAQQGVARNRGLKEVTAPFTLFIGDDIFLRPDACAKHLEIHEKLRAMNQQTAVLGYTAWDPALEITPVMRWLDRTGWQFGYPLISQYAHDFVPADIQHRFTYTSHISLPTDIARAHPFNEDTRLYGWEDILWGMELRDAGLKLLYEPDAKALHHHHITLEVSLKRMETLGESAIKMKRLNPALDRVPTGFKLLAYNVLSLLPTMRGRHAKAFLAGLKRGKSLA